MNTGIEHLGTLDPLLFEMGRDAIFGLCVMALVLIFNGLCFTQVLFFYRRRTTHIFETSVVRITLYFVTAVLALVISQMCSIMIWGTALYTKELIQSPSLAILFSGSCYTTIGVFSDLLPTGWKSIAFYIAFSGLFSFAWATSIMMSMVESLTKAWDKTARKQKQLD